MMFFRVNDHMVSCAIEENEIKQMGYQLADLYKNRELVGQFMREVYEKAKEIGFQIADHIQTVQVAVTQNGQFILNFIESNPEEQINDTIHNLLDAAEAVEYIGKDRLEEILSMSGLDKTKAFQECMIEIRNEFYPDESVSEELLQNDSKQEQVVNTENAGVQKHNIFFLIFDELSKVQMFSKKVSYEVPGRLYKDKERYVMLIDIGELSVEKQRSFLYLAEEYTTAIQKGTQMLTYMEEHAEVLVKSNPITVMKEI